jgi:hypothetical protein
VLNSVLQNHRYAKKELPLPLFKILSIHMTFEELIKNHSADVIEKFITEVLSKDFLDIQFDYFGQDQWSVITSHQYEEDREISLRIHLNDYYDLYFGYYDDQDEFIEIVHPLTEEEKKILPERLIKVMKKVLQDEKGMRIPNKLLFR